MRIHGFYKILPNIIECEEKDLTMETYPNIWNEISNSTEEFLEKLDNFDASTSLRTGFETYVSVVSFLKGYCHYLALKINEIFGYQIEVMEIDGEFTHMYCTYVKDNVKYYIDSRGITDSWKLFSMPFKPFESSLLIKKLNSRFQVEKYLEEADEYFGEDENSNWACKWYLDNYRHFVSMDEFFGQSGC